MAKQWTWVPTGKTFVDDCDWAPMSAVQARQSAVQALVAHHFYQTGNMLNVGDTVMLEDADGTQYEAEVVSIEWQPDPTKELTCAVELGPLRKKPCA